MKPVKFGIIGTGMIAGKHALALERIPGAELVAVCDADPGRARTFAACHRCRAAGSLAEFLAMDIEVVTIATPSGLHAAVAVPAARAGKHIVCEKPLEVTPAKTREIIDACEAAGVLLSAIFQSRYSDEVRLFKGAVEVGRFGDMVLANASVRWFRTRDYYRQASWRGTRALDGGGALMNQAIHTVDLLLYLNGPVAEVSGRVANIMHLDIEVEDAAVGWLAFANGSLGTLEASTACRPGFPRRIELSGTRGSAVLEGERIVRWCFDEEEPGDAEIRCSGSVAGALPGGAGDPAAIDCEGHRRQFAEMVAAIREGVPLTSSGREGKRAVDLIAALYESAAGGKPVKLSP